MPATGRQVLTPRLVRKTGRFSDLVTRRPDLYQLASGSVEGRRDFALMITTLPVLQQSCTHRKSDCLAHAICVPRERIQ